MLYEFILSMSSFASEQVKEVAIKNGIIRMNAPFRDLLATPSGVERVC